MMAFSHYGKMIASPKANIHDNTVKQKRPENSGRFFHRSFVLIRLPSRSIPISIFWGVTVPKLIRIAQVLDHCDV